MKSERRHVLGVTGRYEFGGRSIRRRQCSMFCQEFTSICPVYIRRALGTPRHVIGLHSGCSRHVVGECSECVQSGQPYLLSMME